MSAALRKLAARKDRFSLVFLDPPYGRGRRLKTLTALAASDLLGPEACVVAEHSRRETLPERLGSSASQARRYGDTQVAFYGVEENSPEQELSG